LTYSELTITDTRARQARCIQPEYSVKSTDWLKAAFTVLLHAAHRKLRFIFDEARDLWLSRGYAAMNWTLSRHV
jgi:hypothetical protein